MRIILAFLAFFLLCSKTVAFEIKFENIPKAKQNFIRIYFERQWLFFENLAKENNLKLPNEIIFKKASNGPSSLFVYQNDKNHIYVKDKFFKNNCNGSRMSLLAHEIGHIIDFNNSESDFVINIKNDFGKVFISKYAEKNEYEYFAEYINYIFTLKNGK